MLWIARRFSKPLNHRPLLYFTTLASKPPPKTQRPGQNSPSPSTRLHFLKPFSSQSSSPPSPPPPPLAVLRGGCYDDGDGANAATPPQSLPLCPGCGVHMQDTHPSFPGFYTRPSTKSPLYHAPLHPVSDDSSHLSVSLKSGIIFEEDDPDRNPKASDPDPNLKPLVCARCHSLRHYGSVKDPAAENLLPDFDFDRMVGPKMVSPSGPRSVVLVVVDAADFDGSFPRKLARLLSASIDKNYDAWKEGKPANVPRTVLVVTKIDLLPPSAVSPEGLEDFARKQARAGGANKLAGVHLVSAMRDWGVRNLLEHVRELAGTRGNVWAVGAQNAGKSTLINAMGRCAGEKVSHLTEAPVPGTTLGILRVEGVLGGQAKLFDTPGILHPYQITTRLTREEQKLVHISKELRPRTYRIKAGHSVHIGGLIRLDVEELSVETIYVTVWASPLVPLHMGKIEHASTLKEYHFGRQLEPPIGEKRVGELGQWVRREFAVSGNSWDSSSVDIAAAGLGWFAIGLKGEAVLGVWTYEGVDIVSRNSLIARRALIFEEAGFTTSKIVSRADSVANKQKQSRPGKKASDPKVKSPAASSLTHEGVICA